MRENRTYGSEGGERLLFPTPIKDRCSSIVGAVSRPRLSVSSKIAIRRSPTGIGIKSVWERSPDRDCWGHRRSRSGDRSPKVTERH